jgi:hypothetical protein
MPAICSRRRRSSATLVQLLLPLRDGLLATADFARAAADVLVALLHRVGPAVERALALLHPLLLGGDLVAAAPSLDLPGFAHLDQLFLAGQHRALAQRFRVALGVLPDARGDFLGSGASGREPRLLFLTAERAPLLQARVATDYATRRLAACGTGPTSCKEKQHGGDDERHARRGNRRVQTH